MPIDPSIALQVRPPQFESAISSLSQAMSLKSMVNAQALQQLQMQNERQGIQVGAENLATAKSNNVLKQREVAGQQLLTDLLQKNTAWVDEKGLVTDHKAVNQGLIGAGRSDIAANYAKQQKEIETASWDALEKELTVKAKMHDRLGSWASILDNADPAQRAAIYPTVLNGIKAEGLLPDEQIAQLPAQYTPEMDPQIKAFVNQAKTASTQFDEHMKVVQDLRAKASAEAEQAAKAAETEKAKAETKKIEAETGTYPQTVAEAQKRVDAIFDPKDKDKNLAATNARYRAQLNALDRFSPTSANEILKQAAKERETISAAQNTVPIKIEQAAGTAAAQAGALTGPALDVAVQSYLNDKTLPRNPVLQSKVLNATADWLKANGMDAQAAIESRRAADGAKKAYDALKTNNSQVEAFSATAKKNMELLQKSADAIGGDSPLFNRPIRAWDAKLLGDPKISAFHAALIPAQTDIAKILNSSNATGVLSDNARKEMEQALGQDATPAMIKSALDVFRTDMANRKESYEAELKDLESQMTVKGKGAPGQRGLIVPGGALEKLLNPPPKKN